MTVSKYISKSIKSCIKMVFVTTGFFITSFLYSCEDFLEVELNRTKISQEVTFADDINAISAINGLYVNLLNSDGFASGDRNSVTCITGLSSDEIAYIPEGIEGIEFNEFEINELRSNNTLLDYMWRSMYWSVYQANSIIEGLNQSKTVSEQVKNQLLGEAYFIRAFSNFYLVNLFGPVPLTTTTDYQFNRDITRSSVSSVYELIISDLGRAKSLLSNEYPTQERIRPNRSAASALLSRVYLYTEKYEEAIIESSSVISNTAYILESDLSVVFLGTSREAIWQLKPTSQIRNTLEGGIFILTGAPNSTRPFSLHSSLYLSFEPNDKRSINWVNTRTASGNTYYYPFKYKIRFGPSSATPTPHTEYSMVFRLAEQFLIRAEAKAKEGDLSGAIDDIDVIRSRAGLPLLSVTNPGLSLEEFLIEIEHERKVELFTEWGHRWLDLKRTNRANNVMSPLKEQWSEFDVLYPIPQNEFRNNPSLGNQNFGY